MSNEAIRFSEYPFVKPNIKKFEKKMKQFIEQLKACSNADDAAKIIKKLNKYNTEIETQTSIIYVMYSCYTQNKEYAEAQEYLDEVSPVFAKYSDEITRLLAGAPYRPELEKKFGSFLFKKFDISLKTFDEKIMDEMMKINKLTSEYDLIFGSAQIEFRGETLNLSQLGKYLQDSERETRKAAAKAMDKWLEEHEQRIGEIYGELVLLRDQMAKKLGYKSFTELGYYMLGRTDYNADMVKVYREQIAKEVVPVCQKLYKQQMKNLGIRKPQYYDYNLMFKSGNPKPAGDREYLVKQAQKMYSDLGPEVKSSLISWSNMNSWI